jgi:hypothetical protein
MGFKKSILIDPVSSPKMGKLPVLVLGDGSINGRGRAFSGTKAEASARGLARSREIKAV